jgi:hypothetical protein
MATANVDVRYPKWHFVAMLISDVNRARLYRLRQSFSEVHAETGNLGQSILYTARFVGKKIVPLTRYGCFAITRRLIASRLRRANAAGNAALPVIGLRILGGIGDYIVIARFVRDLVDCAGPLAFDVYSNKPALAKWVFASVNGFRGSFDEAVFDPVATCYTAAAQISQYAVIDERSFNATALGSHQTLRRVVMSLRRFRPSIEPIIAQQPRLDNFLGQKAIFANRGRRDYLHFMADLAYGGDGLKLDVSHGKKIAHDLGGRPYITVHNGYDSNVVVSHERATKCYPHFGAVIRHLRQMRGDIAFVQVGVQTSEAIREADLNLIGRTTLPEVAGLINGAVLHLDNEGGLVHLARCVGTVCCVVFGPTSSRYFGYPDNINIEPSFCGGCWWVNETWMNHCPRGFETARCMTEQPPMIIAQAVARYLDSTLDPRGLPVAVPVVIPLDAAPPLR